MKLVQIALTWAGNWYRKGEIEQCANWVRQALSEAGHPLANRVSKQPVDGHWTGPALANSLAGRDLGPIVDKIADLKPGAIVFFQDTYDVGPEFGPGTITHVGIYVGDGQMVHRPTASRPVEKVSLEKYGPTSFRCGLLLQDTKVEPAPPPPPPAPPKIRFFLNDRGAAIVATQDLVLKAGQRYPVSFGSSEFVLG